MKREFVRYHLGRVRVIVAVLQIWASLGLLLGLEVPWIGRAAAAGLSLMMLLAVGVRILIKDSLLQTSQALFYLVLNGWLCWAAF
ncbi:MAG: DoxX family protein [Chthoniobacterales bacterium]